MEKIKAVFITIFSALSSLLGALAIPIILLVLCNITDYITGLAAVRYRKQQISSYTSIRGIIKKVCMWLLIAVGAMMVIGIKYMSGSLEEKANYKKKMVPYLVGCVILFRSSNNSTRNSKNI